MTNAPLVRPVHCHLCGQQMYYRGRQEYEPEVRVTVDARDDELTFYVHTRCWDARMASDRAPRDCRLCANYTSQTGGCVSVVQCVDSGQFKATTPRQYWLAAKGEKA